MMENRSEKGQVMVLLILALVGLFAFAALAIDGAVIYSDRRIAQNAADASSLSGIGAAGQEVQWIVKDSWDCSSTEVTTARATAVAEAIASAAVNDYTIDADISDGHGVTTYCSDSDDKYLDVEVQITDETESSFAHLFINRPLVNTVQAITRLHPRFPVAEGYNIISLTDECSGNNKGTVIGGTQDMTLTSDASGDGGGIFSNSCLILNGSSGTITADALIWNTEDGAFIDNGGMTLNPPDIVSGTPDKLQPVIDIGGACDGLPAGTVTNVNMGGGVNDITYGPGTYNRIRVTDSKDMVHLDPGLFCVLGDVTISGNLFEGTGVTIALLGTGNADGFTTAGSSLVQLSAAPADCEASGTCQGAIGGLLIWAHPDNTADIVLTGTSDSYYDGTVYGANNEIQIGGNAGVGSINYGAQLIGDTIKVSGNTTINISYDETYFFHTRAKMEVAK